MHRILSLLSAGAVLSAAVPAWAQFGAAPQLRVIPIPMGTNRISIQNVKDDVLYHLDWSATVSLLDTYEYEISYDNVATISIPQVPLVSLDNTINNNYGMNPSTFRSNQPYDFTMRASQIVTLTSTLTVRTISIRVFRAADRLNSATQATGGWNFEIHVVPPVAPVVGTVDAGNDNLRISWTANNPTQLTSFDVLYCPDVTTSTVIDAKTATISHRAPCRTPMIASGLGATQTNYIVSGLQNDVPAAVAVRAVDIAGNVGNPSPYYIKRPTLTYDFWTAYQASGGSERGGCFIATAAYGSYAHPVVWVLRQFRDRVMKATPLGTALVDAYYRLSPPIAQEVERDPASAAWLRAALIPVAGLAVAWMLLPIGGLVVVGALLWRRRERVRRWLVTPFFLLVLSTGFAKEAKADELTRQKSVISIFGLGFEFKGGPYIPDMANDPRYTSFADVYGTKWKPLFTLGIDVQLYRGIGTAGVGGSFGFLQFVGRAFSSLPQPGVALPMLTKDTTVFNELPLNFVGFYRFDYFADQGFPLVPYVKAGLAYHVWWNTNAVGDISRYTPDTKDSSKDVVGRGGKWGYTGTIGVSVLLNAIEPLSAHRLYELTSIRGTYIFAELQLSKVDGFGASGFDLSDKTWNVGLYLEI